MTTPITIELLLENPYPINGPNKNYNKYGDDRQAEHLLAIAVLETGRETGNCRPHLRVTGMYDQTRHDSDGTSVRLQRDELPPLAVITEAAALEAWAAKHAYLFDPNPEHQPD